MMNFVRALRIPVIVYDGEEADDVIAEYTRAAAADGHIVRIVARDKDFLQLLAGDDVKVYDWVHDKFWDEREAFKRFRVPPHLIPDVQALAGDVADNIPGIRGIGVATAAQLMQEHGSLEAILSDLSCIRPRGRFVAASCAPGCWKVPSHSRLWSWLRGFCSREVIKLHATQLRAMLAVTRLGAQLREPVNLESLVRKNVSPDALAAQLDAMGLADLARQ